MDKKPTPSDLVARRVRELRRERGISATRLAARCEVEGAPNLTAQVIYKLEGQRSNPDRPPRPVTVDELLALAAALDVPVSELLIGVGASYGPMTASGLRRYAAQIIKAAEQIEANPIKWGDDA